MTADAGGLRSLALTVGAARDAVQVVAQRIHGVFTDTSAQLGWWGPAAQAASGLGHERAAQLQRAASAAQALIEAITQLADGLDQHGPALHALLGEAQALDQAAATLPADPRHTDDTLQRRRSVDDRISHHVEALAALDRQAATTAHDAAGVLTSLLGELGQLQWLGGFTLVTLDYAAQQTGAPALPAAPTTGAPGDGDLEWPFTHAGDSPSCGNNASAAERLCSTLNGLSTGAGGVTGMVDALAKRVEEARRIAADPNSTARERLWASRLLADVDEYRGATRIVEIGTSGKYAVLAGKGSPVAGGALAAWSGYQGEIAKGQPTRVAAGVAVSEGAADTLIGWAAVTGGAEAGALVGSAVPVVGTAAGAIVGAVAGGVFAYFANNEANGRIADWWEQHGGDPAQ